MKLRAPHYFLWGNLVFGQGPEDAWAAFRLEGESYPGLSLSRKLELKDRISALAYGIEADFQLIRTARAWDADAYAERALATLDERRGHRAEFEAMLDRHRRGLEARQTLRPELYLLVRLAPPTSEAGSCFKSCSVTPCVASSSAGSPARSEPSGSIVEARCP